MYASLKYVDGQKWTGGYEKAKSFLRESHPELIDQYICVPIDRIQRVFDPQTRWAELNRSSRRSPLIAEALELGQQLREKLQIPDSTSASADSEFGITDSLLWSEGHSESDIDLVVIGRSNAKRLMKHIDSIHESDSFERPKPKRMQAPYSLAVDDWPRILSRKMHMGAYKGRLFSTRVILRDSECHSLLPSEPTNGEISRIEFRVEDIEDSLIFPATYRNAAGDELVDYSVVYEGVFRIGDVVQCECCRETMPNGLNRFVMSGDFGNVSF